jgi:hypothetical protein
MQLWEVNMRAVMDVIATPESLHELIGSNPSPNYGTCARSVGVISYVTTVTRLATKWMLTG